MSSTETASFVDDRIGSYLRLTDDGTLTPSLVTELNEFCDRVEDTEDGSVAVLHTGQNTGTHRQWPGAVNIHLVNRWERALRRVERLGAVTVSVVEGQCASLALEVLLATDHRIATADLALTLPVGGGPFWPGMAIHRLANQLGVVPARRLLLASELDAGHATTLGLVDEVTEDAAAALAAIVPSLRAVDGPEFAIRRRLVLDAPSTSFEDALGVHLAACDRALRHAARPTT